MEFTLTTLAFIGIIIFGAFFVRSMTGFGSSLLAIPLLAIWIDLKFVIPFVTLFEVGISLILIKSVWRQISWSSLAPMILGAVIGSVIGGMLLQSLENEVLKVALGVAVVLFALTLLRNPGQSRRTLSRYWGVLAGAVGGFIGGLFGTSGPPFVAYLSMKLHDKAALRASLIGLFAVEESWRAGVFAVNGLITVDMLTTALWLSPILVLGAVLGHRAHLHMSEIRFRQMVAVLLLISGGLLVF